MIEIEERATGTLFEPTLQRIVDSSELLIKATTYTYWLSQFVVVGLTLLWVYFRHHDRFAGSATGSSLANVDRARSATSSSRRRRRGCSRRGDSSTRSRSTRALNHGSGLIAHTANPYAAMPSLHSMDALIVGVVMFGVCRSLGPHALAAWPAWVWFSVIGTGNHYWLDIVAGVAIAILDRASPLPQRGVFRPLARRPRATA